MDIYEQMEEIVINGKIKKLIIIGAGGMGRTIYSNALECVGYGEVYEVKGFIDDDLPNTADMTLRLILLAPRLL